MCGASGVLFTLDTESGFRDVVFVTASYGLGEMVVQGAVNPDEFYVYKPTLRAGKPAILRRSLGSKQLQHGVFRCPRGARAHRGHAGRSCAPASRSPMPTCRSCREQALAIEEHYGRPMDIEWGKDGVSGKLFIVQARPETVKSRGHATQIERYSLGERGEVLSEGRAIGSKIGSGVARVVRSLDDMARVQPGDVLVADMTDPGLGAGDEALRRDRHQSRWPHLPCRDHRARAGRARRSSAPAMHSTGSRTAT